MCLYLALGLFWLYSAFNDRLRDTAILTTMVFAGGLVATVQEHVMPVRSGVMPVKPPAMFTNVGSGRFGRQHIELSKDQALYEPLTSSRHVDLACGPPRRQGPALPPGASFTPHVGLAHALSARSAPSFGGTLGPPPPCRGACHGEQRADRWDIARP